MIQEAGVIPKNLKMRVKVWARIHPRPYAPCASNGFGQEYTPAQIWNEVQAETVVGSAFITEHYDLSRARNLQSVGAIEKETEQNLANFPRSRWARVMRDMRNLADRVTYHTPIGSFFR